MPHYAKTPILMLTAMRDLDNMGNAYRAGATDYATKPFDIEELTTRLNMAQRSILAGRKEGWVNVDTHTATRRDLSASATGLVDEAAMVSYLTQLPKKQASAVQLYAFAFDEVKAEHNGPTPNHSILQLQKVILAVAKSFDAGQSLMTCTHDSTLVVASTLAASQSNTDIEAKIESVLRTMGYHVAVAMGGPVIPQGSKSERARLAIDRALTLALIRNHEKRDPEYFDAKSAFGGRA
jgi:CheY-like chemotaxis protein